MTEIDVAPPDADFVAMMSRAAEEASPESDAEAPYGWTRDRATGEMRPKKSPGRGGGGRKTPSVEELKASNPATTPAGEEGGGGDGPGPPPSSPAADRPPDESRKLMRHSAPDPGPAPSYSPGMIAKGMNRLYRRAGKIIRAMDEDIGEAVIQSARNTADPGEPDDSVGAAWEELAKTNPRIRRFVMRLIAGGAWGQLVMAHVPILMAIIMKPAILRWIPFAVLIRSMAEPDEDTPAGEGGLPGGMTEADAQQMAGLAQAQMAKMGMSIPPEVAAQMAEMAGAMMNGVPAQSRNQPRRPKPRAERHGGA